MAGPGERLVVALLGLVLLAAGLLLGLGTALALLALVPLGVGLLAVAARGGSLRHLLRALDEDASPDPGAGPAGLLP